MAFRNYIFKKGFKKYKNRSQKCLSGHLHDSVGEARYCDELRMRKIGGDIQDYKSQHNIPLTVMGITVCHHRVDFLVTNKEGKLEYHEYKGFPTALWDLKRKLTQALYPDIPYIVIKESFFR